MQLNSIFGLPYLGFPPPEKAIFIIQELLDTFPEMMAEFEGVELIQVATIALIPTWFHTAKKQVKSVADLQGLKIGVAGGGGPSGIWLENMGCVPVAISFEDFYVSLERGLIDGHISGFGPQFAQGTIELCPYKADMGSALTIGYHPVIMNPDSFHSLPPDIQKIFKDRELWEFYTKTLQAEEDGSTAGGLAQTKELGHTYVDFSEADKEAFREAATPIHEAWIADVESKGKPGREVYEEMMRLIEKYK
jgi:TRAP-type C4-dicarboxylate transport system substrate-binding protein